MAAKPNYYEDDPDDQHSTLKESKDEGASAVGLLPKSILMGKKFNVGDEVVLEITAIHDDQVEVKYSTEEAPEDKSEEGAPAEEPTEAPVEEGAEAPAETPMYE